MEKTELALDIANILYSAQSDKDALWKVIALLQKKYLVIDNHHLHQDNPYNRMGEEGYLVESVQVLLAEFKEGE
ncbi:hypothetical protein CPT_Moonbeam214 [Bacillus phage Moonbeam]|uniref:Uncharacterized protein n=1 Tax=Bacillus phage Moonbeam TaxID=1540091 RepID=A0A0A0RNL7_9CAUD|nr:hypothetical protein CPT_Moonbeam214 [Bacillus phage Moonbeam]AIW03612.1 hypothetical protein CPT_Moonbeam214 [Bacillus phage Moonbeam]